MPEAPPQPTVARHFEEAGIDIGPEVSFGEVFEGTWMWVSSQLPATSVWSGLAFEDALPVLWAGAAGLGVAALVLVGRGIAGRPPPSAQDTEPRALPAQVPTSAHAHFLAARDLLDPDAVLAATWSFVDLTVAIHLERAPRPHLSADELLGSVPTPIPKLRDLAERYTRLRYRPGDRPLAAVRAFHEAVDHWSRGLLPPAEAHP